MPYRRGDPLIHSHPLFLAASRTLLHLVAILGWPLVRLMYHYGVHGRKNLAAAAKRRQPIIFVANHSIPLDSLLHGIAIQPRLSWFTIIEETVMTPILGNLVRLLRGIPIPTDPARIADIDTAMAIALRPWGSVFFYAEGECFLRNQEIKPFKLGAFYYAIKEGALIVPIVSVLKAAKGRLIAPTSRVSVDAHILPAIEAPPAAGRRSADLHNAAILAASVRATMQAHIDAQGGDKSLYRGPMPRIKGVNDYSH
ncbi:MAG: lysophospholipid acyltransferase family protein [Rectinemataceae bacterium]|nr:lysophospholipid acyltransferase family protein [Rectinemataceae bacterium]